MEQPPEQLVGRDGRIDQLVLANGLEQGLSAGPHLFGVAAGVLVAGDVLDQQAAGAPDESVVRAELAHSQADAGRGLFRLGEVGLGAKGQGFALDGRDALVAIHLRALVDGHGEDALAQQAARAGPQESLRRLSHLVRIVPAIAAQGPRGVVVGHRQRDRPIALGLDDQPAVELEAGADQGGQGAGFAQQIGHGLGIGVAGEHLVDHPAQPRDAATYGRLLDLERSDNVFGGGVV